MTDKQTKIQAVKAEIFDIMRQQGTLQQQINGLEQIRQQKLTSLGELEQQQALEQQVSQDKAEESDAAEPNAVAAD